ncbi:hypothetical protein BDR04DRAFT_735083 [Suillus decipiens]|nr:hypothetical protein BDR04DRAFT_735083 [Suillus decipiens]
MASFITCRTCATVYAAPLHITTAKSCILTTTLAYRFCVFMMYDKRLLTSPFDTPLLPYSGRRSVTTLITN